MFLLVELLNGGPHLYIQRWRRLAHASRGIQNDARNLAFDSRFTYMPYMPFLTLSSKAAVINVYVRNPNGSNHVVMMYDSLKRSNTWALNEAIPGPLTQNYRVLRRPRDTYLEEDISNE